MKNGTEFFFFCFFFERKFCKLGMNLFMIEKNSIISGIYEICTKLDLAHTRHVRLMLVIYSRHLGTQNKANRLKNEHRKSTENMNVWIFITVVEISTVLSSIFCYCNKVLSQD